MGSRKAQGIALVNKKKTHCKNGHAFTSDNLYVRKDGKRRCKTCELNYFKRRRRKSIINLSDCITVI